MLVVRFLAEPKQFERNVLDVADDAVDDRWNRRAFAGELNRGVGQTTFLELRIAHDGDPLLERLVHDRQIGRLRDNRMKRALQATEDADGARRNLYPEVHAVAVQAFGFLQYSSPLVRRKIPLH